MLCISGDMMKYLIFDMDGQNYLSYEYIMIFYQDMLIRCLLLCIETSKLCVVAKC